MNRYSHVPRHTREFYVAQADAIYPEEMRRARLADAAEPATDKAWRGVLQAQEMVRYQIGIMRRALFDLGRPLTPRSLRLVRDEIAYGHRWYDPNPQSTLTEAAKNLLGNRALLAQRWDALREAENNERRKA